MKNFFIFILFFLFLSCVKKEVHLEYRNKISISNNKIVATGYKVDFDSIYKIGSTAHCMGLSLVPH